MSINFPVIPFPPIALIGLFLKIPEASNLLGSSIDMPISVIIPAKNHSVKGAIESCKNQSVIPAQIIVVDDGSDIPLQHKGIIIIRNEKSIGKADSINKAIKFINYPLVCILDCDTILGEDYFFEVGKLFANPKMVAACGLILPSNKGIIPDIRMIDYIYGQETYKKIQQQFKMILVSAGCSTIWKTNYLKDNPIPTDTVVEDLRATWVAESSGLTIGFTDKAVAYTEEPVKVDDFYNQIRRWFSIVPAIKNTRLNKNLKILMAWVFTEYALQILFLGAMTYLLITQQFTNFAFFILIDLILVSIVTCYYGLKLKINLWGIFKSLPFYHLYRIANTVTFIISLINPKKRWK